MIIRRKRTITKSGVEINRINLEYQLTFTDNDNYL